MDPFTSNEIAGLRVLLVDDEVFIRDIGPMHYPRAAQLRSRAAA